jgi:hypothetical protein
MDQFGVRSRFQAGILAAQTGLVPDLHAGAAVPDPHGGPGEHPARQAALPGPPREAVPPGRSGAGPAGTG